MSVMLERTEVLMSVLASTDCGLPSTELTLMPNRESVGYWNSLPQLSREHGSTQNTKGKK